MKKRQNGSTIVELTIYMGLLSMFLLVLTNIFLSILDVQLDAEATSSVEQDGRYIFSRLSYDVGRASAIALPAAAGDEGGTLQMSIGGTTYTYALSTNNLTLTDAAGTYVLNGYGTTVSNVSFRRLGNASGKHTLRVNFTVTSTIARPQGPETRDFQTTMGLR